MSIKLLYDTDIGSDIDDAVCLAYLLAQPECDLLGITTVTGETGKRARLASVLCKVAGKEIPIFPGAEDALLIPQKQPHVPQFATIEKWDHDSVFPRGQAVEFLRQTIRANPSQVVLLATGPFTNIALLFGVDAEIPSLLKGLVTMGGVFMHGRPGVSLVEWNALVDPHATAMMYRASLSSHRSLGLDVTSQVKMDAQQFRERCNVPLLRPVLDFAEVWFEHAEQITFHDPLAATTIFDDTICTFTRGAVDVELASTGLAGFTYWDPSGPNTRHEVASQVDPARFFAHYFSVFT